MLQEEEAEEEEEEKEEKVFKANSVTRRTLIAHERRLRNGLF